MLFNQLLTDFSSDKYSKLDTSNLEDIVSSIDTSQLLGELGHPLAEIIDLSKVSHKITNLNLDGLTVTGDVEILTTSNGKILNTYLENLGSKLVFAPRALGFIDIAGNVTKIDRIVSWDVIDILQ